MKNINFKNENEFLKIIDPWHEFNYVKGMEESKESLLKTYKKITKFPLPPRVINNSNSEIVVIGVATFFRLSSELKNKSHVVLRPKDLFRYTSHLFKFFKNFTLDLRIYKNIYKQLIKNNKTEYEYIKKILLDLNPRILIISSTIDPVQRIWAFWARNIGIKIICIQHGVFSSLSAPELLERNIVDYYFSFCEKQSKLIEQIIPANKHRYLYSEGLFNYKIPKSKKIRLCLIGTDHERYGSKGKKNKLSVIKIYEQLIRLIWSNLKFEYEIFYKRHPSEELIGKIEDYVKIVQNNKLDSIDIFFGVASTKLLNLASQNRCAIQIRSKDFPQDKYENYNFCKTIELEEIKKNGFRFLHQDTLAIPCLKKNNFNENLIKILNKLKD